MIRLFSNEEHCDLKAVVPSLEDVFLVTYKDEG